MKYVVFTTKHHDGFSMFDTKYTDYRVTSPATPFHANPKANIAKEIFDAFRAEGFLVGAYFSKPDWHSEYYWWPNFATPDRNVNYDPERYPARWRSFVDFMHSQVLELMTDYGRMDILWLDGGWVKRRSTDEIERMYAERLRESPSGFLKSRVVNQDPRMDELVAKAREKQPGLIVVDRAVYGKNQNYLTPENRVPEKPLPYPWESCITSGGGWSFTPNAKYMSGREGVHLLVDIVAKGGNLLLNVAPGPDGTWQQGAYDLLAEMGAWLTVNGEAIYGSRPVAPHIDGRLRLTRGKDGSAYFVYLAGEQESRHARRGSCLVGTPSRGRAGDPAGRVRRVVVEVRRKRIRRDGAGARARQDACRLRVDDQGEPDGVGSAGVIQNHASAASTDRPAARWSAGSQPNISPSIGVSIGDTIPPMLQPVFMMAPPVPLRGPAMPATVVQNGLSTLSTRAVATASDSAASQASAVCAPMEMNTPAPPIPTMGISLRPQAGPRPAFHQPIRDDAAQGYGDGREHPRQAADERAFDQAEAPDLDEVEIEPEDEDVADVALERVAQGEQRESRRTHQAGDDPGVRLVRAARRHRAVPCDPGGPGRLPDEEPGRRDHQGRDRRRHHGGAPAPRQHHRGDEGRGDRRPESDRPDDEAVCAAEGGRRGPSRHAFQRGRVRWGGEHAHHEAQRHQQADHAEHRAGGCARQRGRLEDRGGDPAPRQYRQRAPRSPRVGQEASGKHEERVAREKRAEHAPHLGLREPVFLHHQGACDRDVHAAEIGRGGRRGKQQHQAPVRAGDRNAGHRGYSIAGAPRNGAAATW